MKKGFTLLEMLAVIIVLGLVAVITIPIVTREITVTKKKSLALSLESIVHAIELNLNEQGSIEKPIMYVIADGVITPKISYKGKITGDGYIQVNNRGDMKVLVSEADYYGLKEFTDMSVDVYDGKYNGAPPTIVNADKSGAAVPKLGANMIPVKWIDNVLVKADFNNVAGPYQWYDYDAEMWANTISVANDSVSKYKAMEIGKQIDINDVKMFFVAIPRFGYILNPDKPDSIKIKFLSIFEKKTDGMKIPEAFNWDEELLQGFWINKFELTRDVDSILSVPNKDILRKTTLANYYKELVKIKDESHTKTDLHIIKNSEWGATALLAHSKYGYCKDDICTLLKKNSSWMTGSYDDNNKYDSPLGMTTSTTANIYGVYDMIGGTQELTTGTNSIKMIGLSSLPTAYYDDYSTNEYFVGDGMYENSSWYGNDFIKLGTNYTQRLYTRGGNRYDGKNIFQSKLDSGSGGNNNGTRITAIIK